MTVPFWKPARFRGTSVWWTRCDNCLWSGPVEWFEQWVLDNEFIWICDNAGCAHDVQLAEYLASQGWRKE